MNTTSVTKFLFQDGELVVPTSGKGYWSTAERDVEIVRIELEHFYRHLKVYWKRGDWNVPRDGLIHTDPRFERQLRQRLEEILPHFRWDSLRYTEQGMQGKNFVSMELVPWASRSGS